MGGGSITHQVVLWVEVVLLNRWCCGWRYYSPGGAVGGGSITHQVVLWVEVEILTRWCCGWM